MAKETRCSEAQNSEFDTSLITPTGLDWDIISSSPLVNTPSDRCYIIGNLAVLDPQRPVSAPTQEDWEWFMERTDSLIERDDAIVRIPLICAMAKVDRERACRAFKPDELNNIWAPVLHDVLSGKQEPGLFPGSMQELLIYADFERTKQVFEDFGQKAWESEKRYVSWLRRESPAQAFTLLAALSEIDQERTVSIMEKSDWQLALEGLAYYRKSATENVYRIEPLITHLAALKKLTPLFERLFQQAS